MQPWKKQRFAKGKIRIRLSGGCSGQAYSIWLKILGKGGIWGLDVINCIYQIQALYCGKISDTSKNQVLQRVSIDGKNTVRLPRNHPNLLTYTPIYHDKFGIGIGFTTDLLLLEFRYDNWTKLQPRKDARKVPFAGLLFVCLPWKYMNTNGILLEPQWLFRSQPSDLHQFYTICLLGAWIDDNNKAAPAQKCVGADRFW